MKLFKLIVMVGLVVWLPACASTSSKSANGSGHVWNTNEKCHQSNQACGKITIVNPN